MPFPALNSIIQPSLPISFDETVRVLETPFGNGYKQRSLESLNSIDSIIEAVWENITLNEKDILQNFFRGRAGIYPFTLTLDSTTYTFICKKWGGEKKASNVYGFRATLERTFDL